MNSSFQIKTKRLLQGVAARMNALTVCPPTDSSSCDRIIPAQVLDQIRDDRGLPLRPKNIHRYSRSWIC
jgi:hypothetical protein